ncbi:MAG TPA: hypothetical protein VMV20_00535 [Chitinophagaceae bacterium]|nr:hypothetical protein [Chitinophagaceae bacterium]
MMRTIRLFLILPCFALLCSQGVAQYKSGKSAQPGTSNAGKNKTSGSDSTSSFRSSLDTLKNDYAQIRSLFGKGKARDTINIMIPNIAFEDANLAHFKQGIQSARGVKGVSMGYKGGCAMIKVVFKGNTTQLWDALPSPAKQPFTMVQADDNNIQLAYKAPNSGS